MRKRYCFALDLRAGPAVVAKYEAYHQSVWPAITESIWGAGIEHMEIYRVENRLFMIMEVNEQFSFEKKRMMDASKPVVQEWETLDHGSERAILIRKKAYDGCRQAGGAGMGNADVEVPAGPARGRRLGEMDADEKKFSTINDCYGPLNPYCNHSCRIG